MDPSIQPAVLLYSRISSMPLQERVKSFLSASERCVTSLHVCCSANKIQLNDEASMNIFNMVNSGCSYIGCAMGSCYPQEFIPRLLQAYEDGKFPFDDLIETYRPRDINQAVEDMLKGRTVKAVLMWD